MDFARPTEIQTDSEFMKQMASMWTNHIFWSQEKHLKALKYSQLIYDSILVAYSGVSLMK